MKTTFSLVQLGVLGLVVALASACSSSSTPSEKSDAAVSDTGSSTHDTGATKSDGSSKKDAAEDTGSSDAAPFVLDAAMAGMGVSAACEACIQTNCLAKAQGCFQTSGCKAIEECGLSCIAEGGAAGTCVPGCIQSANPDGSTSSPAQQASIALSYCLQDFCTSDCN